MASLTEQIGEESLRRLRLPSPKRLDGLHPNEIEAYWIVAQCIDKLLSKKPLSDFLVRRLTTDLRTLQAIWPDFMPASTSARGDIATPPTEASAQNWLDSLKGCSAIANAQPPATHPSVLLKYLFQVAELADLSALDNISPEDLVSIRIGEMRTDQILASAIPVDNPILLLAAPKGKKRNSLLRIKLTRDDAGQYLRLADQPDMAVARTAFFDKEGEPRGEFSQESLQQEFLAPWSTVAIASWQDFTAELEQRCVSLTGTGLLNLPISLFGNYAGNLRAYLVDSEKLRTTDLGKQLEDLLTLQRESTLLNGALAPPEQPNVVRVTTGRRDLFLGHMDERSGNARSGFPLDPTQRLAAMTALAMDQYPERLPILPVNGPPGTGKTSFLRAVLASTWVRAAYEEASSPPLVVGTGATNKAVSNVIEAFSTVAAIEGGGVTQRWISGLPSYGWLFPSKEAKERFPDLMHLVYSDVTRSSFTPAGGAIDFGSASIDGLAQEYCLKGIGALKLSSGKSWTPGSLVKELHKRIAGQVEALRAEQKAFGQRLESLNNVWGQARSTAIPTVNVRRLLTSLAKDVEAIRDKALTLNKAIASARLCVALHSELTTGFKGVIRSVFGNFFFKDKAADLASLSQKTDEALIGLGRRWPDTLLERQSDLLALEDEKLAIKTESTHLDALYSQIKDNLRRLEELRSIRHEAFHRVFEWLHSPATLPPRELGNIRYILRFLRSKDAQDRQTAEDMLWHRFDARQDYQYRFPLFHLAARYWEGRWIVEQLERAEAPLSDEQARLRCLMMLGVIIVSTTHKLPSIGKHTQIDMLVVDESGQCGPEVGAVVLSYAKSALLVGDTKQLQPVATLSLEQSLHIAKVLDLELPPAFCAARGSAMAIARFVTPYTDAVDGNGVTLLYHYRCHPKIIGYCNQLLYGGQIRYVRPDKPTQGGLPPMSWVDVPEAPIKVGSTWSNEHELQAIGAWIREHHRSLSQAYGKPLDEVLAVISPLRGQALLAKTYLAKALEGEIPKDVFDRITIGTVHALQGAERPVVAFSLVQHRSIGKLFADRDGGFLMNVAASRAKDAFIVFASRETLRPAPNDRVLSRDDEGQPVGQLGAYLRRVGSRLYPRRLVVVEAPGKIARIQRALGTNSFILATGGYLADSRLDKEGNFEWGVPQEEFVKNMATHAGLLDEIVVATDDDIAGELIGMQVAEVAAEQLGSIPVRRMRFHSLDADHLQDSLLAAGGRFDGDYLAAALTRLAIQQLDHSVFRSRLPGEPYVSEQERAIVDLVERYPVRTIRTVQVTAQDEAGTEFQGYVPINDATLSFAATYSGEDVAQDLASRLSGMTMQIVGESSVERVAGLYPPSTTMRLLAASANEYGMLPWDTQEHLNAMYQEGAAV